MTTERNDRNGTANPRELKQVKTAEQIQAKINELQRYDDYSHGPRGENKRYKHQGWIDALRWVLGHNFGEEP